MMKNKYERMLERFKEYYSYLYDQVVDWWPSGRLCITIKLDDGQMFEFDSLNDTIRKIQTDNYINDTDVLRKEVGRNLRKAIDARGMSQNEIADKCGITQAMLSRYIHGTSMPGLDKVYTFANVLGCRVIDITGEVYETTEEGR